MQISAIQREDYVRDSSSGELASIRRETCVAMAFSVFLHVAAAAVFFLIAANAMTTAARENPRIIHVTWVEATRFADREHQPVSLEALQSPGAIRRDSDSHKVQTVTAPQEKKKTPAAVNDGDKAAAPGTPAHKLSASDAGRDDRHMVTLTHGLKTHGTDSAAVRSSMARPRYRENSPPSYPVTARARGYEGVVLVSAEILTGGSVGNLKIKSSSGYDILDKSALDAVKTWKFDPAKSMGRPVIAWVDIPVRYVLRNSR